MALVRGGNNQIERTCQTCGITFWADRQNIRRDPERSGRFCSRVCARAATANTPEDMWRHVDKSGQCWPWTAAAFANGYGAFRLGGRAGRTAYAHRLAWELTNGPIPDGVEVCHACDVPACVNPAHLFLGTHAENMRDMADKGRSKTPNAKGEAHPRARLKATDIAEIRARYAAGGVLQRELAAEYGVDQVHISRVVRGLSWADHVSNP